MPDVDVTVVGARVAGSTLAALLGEHGHRILLLDRATFPSDTLSTHFFRAPALRAFQRLGVFDEVQSTAPHLVSSYNDVDGHTFSEPVEGPDGLAYYLCVRRITLDDILTRRARREPLVDLREGAKVQSLLWEDSRVTGVQWTQGNQSFETTARVVVGADGFNSVVARQVSPQVEHTEPINRAMYYAYYAGFEPQSGPAAEFHYRGNDLVYVFPCDGGLTLLAASVPISEFPVFRREPAEMLESYFKSRPTLAPRLRAANRVGRIMGEGNIPGYMRVPYGAGWALVGDASLIMDPYSGQGIDQGSTHAVLLADALHAWLADELPWAEAMTGYHRARNDFTQKTYLRTCTFSRDLRPMTRAALRRRGLQLHSSLPEDDQFTSSRFTWSRRNLHQ